MFDVDTLLVISSARGEYVLNDMLAAISWSCTGGSFFTVVVDNTGTIETLSAPGKYQILHSDLPAHTPAGFHRAAGLKWAIDQGMAYRQVIMLSDTCMITTQGLDSFFNPQTQKDNIGLLGVRAHRYTEAAWEGSRTQLFEWQVPVEGWERPPASLCDDFLVMAGRFAGPVFQKGLLVPTGCENWRGTYGDYISWLCHMLGFYVISWGFETKPLPPLYVNHAQGQYLPAPHLFGQRLLVFSPITNVMGYGEGDLRELYKQQRNEPCREVSKLQPIVTGPEQRDVTFS